MITKRIQAKTETSILQACLQSIVSLWNCQTKTSHLYYFYMDVQVYLCNLQRNNAPSLSESYLNNRSGLALWCLQTIHLFTVSLVSLCLNTFLTFQRLLSIQKSAKRKRERAFFFSFSFFFLPLQVQQIHKDPLRATWDFEGGREQWPVLSQFYRYPVAIGVAVLVNNCFLWQNSGSSSDSQWRQVRSSFEIRNEKVLREDELRKLQSQKKTLYML